MRFLVDAQLPPALARLLREHGHGADHVIDIGPGDTSDRELWRFALDNQAVIVTKDEDFSNMIAHGSEAPSIVWVRIGNTRRTVLLAHCTCIHKTPSRDHHVGCADREGIETV